MKVLEIAKKNVISLGPQATLEEAIKKMKENDVGSVVITKNGELLGILTERDVVRLIGSGVPLNVSLESVMNRNPITASPEDDVLVVAHKMVSHGLRHIPIVEKRKVIGIVSIKDVLRYLLSLEEVP